MRNIGFLGDASNTDRNGTYRKFHHPDLGTGPGRHWNKAAEQTGRDRKQTRRLPTAGSGNKFRIEVVEMCVQRGIRGLGDRLTAQMSAIELLQVPKPRGNTRVSTLSMLQHSVTLSYVHIVQQLRRGDHPRSVDYVVAAVANTKRSCGAMSQRGLERGEQEQVTGNTSPLYL